MKYSKLPILSWFKTMLSSSGRKRMEKFWNIFEKRSNLRDYLSHQQLLQTSKSFLEVTISRSSIIYTLYNWSLIVTSLDLLTIRFRSLKLKLCNHDNLNRIRIRLSIHRFFLSSRVNYNIFLFYPNACLFEWFLVRWQKKKIQKLQKYHRYSYGFV